MMTYRDVIPHVVARAELTLPGGLMVNSFMIRGSSASAVVDTLMRPLDMERFRDADYAIYTHGDWDHCFGTGGIKRPVVVAHQLTSARLQQDEIKVKLRNMKQKDPVFFNGAYIILPQRTFAEEMEIALGDMSLLLSHLPGHTEDSIVAYVPEHSLLLVGDALEDPAPYIKVPGYTEVWAKCLRKWAERGVKRVFCSHSNREMKVDDLLRTADYLETFKHDVRELLAEGCGEGEIAARLPLAKYLSGRVTPVWKDVQEYNTKAMVKEVRGELKH